MDRSSKYILRNLIIDFVCLLVVGLAVLMFFLFGKPFKRGFFCNDESLMYPYHSSTVTSPMLYVIGLFLPISMMVVGEFVHSRHCSAESSKVLLGYTIPSWIWMAYTKVENFGFGAATTVLITDVAKYSIGRLRPHFMTLCVPNVNCSLPENQFTYIEDFTCTAPNVSAKLLKEIRLSFPSGHSSFSAYTMIYLVMYLQLRVTWSGSKLFKQFIQLICFLIAWFTALSRVSDYKHHWSDVLTGFALGTAVALAMVTCKADLFKENCVQLKDKQVRTSDYEGEAATQVNNGNANHNC